ncbi:b366ed3b-f2fa-4df4-aca4-f86e63795736 [Sclerotinia trifoliorum]|uniref:B366ed3b-f2fa-4df4-aca4-f86e63795736 n=1 Tax=Sclerotinia trifoliorum TaxID=28548 RepID=A0A8H2VQC8_9HELO|nr:b366ed3b-f2fa-4df4-aca4-f86e63795736 [Sclerotinia trifoliorum]
MSNLTHSYGNGSGYGNATLLMNPHLCTLDTCDLSLASFQYLPTVVGNTLYAGLFGIFLVAQLGLGIKFKTWGYMVAIMLGLILEVIGYIARVLIHNSPFDNNYFLMYLICLTIAPAFLTAAIYLCLSRIVILYGQEISRFRPGTYTIIFCTCDIISLVLQAVGGAIASLADTIDQSDLGKNIMLAGLAFQVFSLILFTILCTDFAWRVHRAKGFWNARYVDLVSSLLFKSFLAGLFLATITILARSIYRCIELSGGFHGSLFVSHEAEFMVLEGVMIVLATGALTLLHPGIAMRGAWTEVNFKFRSKNQGVKHLKRESAGSDIEMQSGKMFMTEREGL